MKPTGEDGVADPTAASGVLIMPTHIQPVFLLVLITVDRVRFTKLHKAFSRHRKTGSSKILIGLSGINLKDSASRHQTGQPKNGNLHQVRADDLDGYRSS